MKNQMIKLSVIAAVLSGMTFTAAAAAPSTTVALDLTAKVVTASCNLTVKDGQSVMAWPQLTPMDFPAIAAPATGAGDAKEITMSVGACQGNNVGTDGIKLTAVQGAGTNTSLLANNLWGDDDTTGVGFLISTSQDDTNFTQMKPNNPDIVIQATTAGAATGITGITDVNVKVEPAAWKTQANVAAGEVHAIVTLAAIYD